MTIDEAIKHCKEKQKVLNEQACSEDMTEKEAADCLECATEHLQLATWLEELQEWRKLKMVCAFDGYAVYSCKSKQTKEERQRGEWLHPYKVDIACECSNCRMQMPTTNYFNFCPNCGADMREEGDT